MKLLVKLEIFHGDGEKLAIIIILSGNTAEDIILALFTVFQKMEHTHRFKRPFFQVKLG